MFVSLIALKIDKISKFRTIEAIKDRKKTMMFSKIAPKKYEKNKFKTIARKNIILILT